MEFFTLIYNFLSEHPQFLLVTGLLSVALLVISIVVLPILVIRIPHDYFSPEKAQIRLQKNRTLFGLLVALTRNVFALIVILLGILMLVLPGQGLLTILVGIFLLDVPAKYTLERRLIKQPSVLKSINWIRAKKNREPLQI